ncbi:MAG: hypothetical protein AB1586_05040 [Pseudomonadota bacterium]
MTARRIGMLRAAVWASTLGWLAAAAGLAPALAATGSVRVVVTKAGFIVGAGGGSGTLSFHGRNYPLSIRGMSVGVTVGASKTRLIGRAYHLNAPSDIAGIYSAAGTGGAFGVGDDAVWLQNAKGVVLELKGRKLGLEFSAAVSGIEVSLR